MGKGNRNSQKRLEKELANKDKILAKEKAKKNSKRSGKLLAAICIVVALIVVAVICLSILKDSGVFLRHTPAVTKGETVANAAMMTFFVNDYIMTWYQNYYTYIVEYKIFSVNLAYDLKAQTLTSTDAYFLGDASLAGMTWYDYFINGAMETVEAYVIYAEGARLNNITLTDAQKAEIDVIIENMKASLKANGMTSFEDQYGQGIKEKDIRACYELMYLAQAYAEHLNNTTISQLESEYNGNKDSNALITFRENNKSSFYFAEYLSYTISISEKSYKDDQKKYDEAVSRAEECAKIFEAASTPEEFVKLVEEYKKSPDKFMIVHGIIVPNETESGSTSETESASETETTSTTESKSETESKTEKETTLEELLSKYEGTIYYETKSELGNWIFGESGAEINDTKVVTEKGSETVTEKAPATETNTESNTETGTTTESNTEPNTEAAPTSETNTNEESKSETATETETEKESGTTSSGSASIVTKTYETFKITAYMLLSKPHYDTNPTHHIAYVISDNKTAAQAFLDAFNASSDKTADGFEALAKEHYDKMFANHDHSTHAEGEEPTFSYAQVENAKENYFADDFSAYNDWFTVDTRKSGDVVAELIAATSINTSTNKAVTYYAVLFYEDISDAAWYVDALSGAADEKINAWYLAERSLVQYNMDAIGKIVPVSITVSE